MRTLVALCLFCCSGSYVFVPALGDKPRNRINSFLFANTTSWFSATCVNDVLSAYVTDSCANKTISDFGTDAENILINYVMPKVISLLGPMNCVQSATGNSIITAIMNLVNALLDLGAPIYNHSTQACLVTQARQANKTARLDPGTRSMRVLHRKSCHVPLVQRILLRWCVYASTPNELNAMRQCLPTFYQWSLYSTDCPAATTAPK